MATLHKRPRSPFWFISYRAADGRWLKKSSRTADRKAAHEIARALETAEEAAGRGTMTAQRARELLNEVLERVGGERVEQWTTRGWFTDWIANKTASRAAGTADRYRQPLMEFVKHLGARADHPLSAVAPADVRAFRDRLRGQGLSPVTVNFAHKRVAAPFGDAVRQGLLSANPAHGVDFLPTHGERTAKEVFTADEIRAIIEAAPSQDWQGVILLGALTGLRLGDILRLRWHNIDLQAGVIRLVPKKTARLERALVVPMHPEVETFLLKHPTGARDADPVFPSLANLAMSGKSGASMAFKRIMERAGVAAGTAREAKGRGRSVSLRSFHSLRHSYISRLASVGVGIETRQSLVGHSTADQTRHYTHAEIQSLRDAVAKLPGIGA
jgi:integrase